MRYHNIAVLWTGNRLSRMGLSRTAVPVQSSEGTDEDGSGWDVVGIVERDAATYHSCEPQSEAKGVKDESVPECVITHRMYPGLNCLGYI